MPYPWNALEELNHADLNAAVAWAASQGGGGSYTLPVASTVTLGGVKVDGSSIVINSGVLSAAVASVAGRTGAVALTHSDLTDWSSATAGFLTSFGAQGTAAANTGTTSLSPTGLSSIVVTVSSNTTINVQPGVAGQVLRLELKQDGTGGRTIALGGTIAFGAELASYVPSTAPNTRDLLQLIYAGGSAWMLVAVSHGFGV